ncbi:G-protein coupled receptor 68-like [Halichoeres trimaculatus]|uniref:G-protein coupled receptor 68-like n=1 Tax=Halichoeres trimaculatus TaxID=147232 RepID=UPI003D9FA18A
MEDDYGTTFPTDIFDHRNFTVIEPVVNLDLVMHVATCIIISIGLPLTLLTIFALCSLVRKDHVAPIFVINLLITDLFQLCCIIVLESGTWSPLLDNIYLCPLLASIGFMVCVSLERYLVIAHPLWYRFRRNIKFSVAVCVVVWLIPPGLIVIVIHWVRMPVSALIFTIFLIIPFPLFIFFLVGTLRALSTSVSVSSEEKRRIVGILVLVLLIYSCLFLPYITCTLVEEARFNYHLNNLSFMLVKMSPLADLLLYIFIRKDTVGKFLAAACCCKMERNEPTVEIVDI